MAPERCELMSDDTAGRRPPSIRDVARLADVSHQTVSRVLNNHPSIRPETRDRVVEAMETLNYRPNRAARALVTSRSQTLGILAAASSMYGPASSIASIEAAARARGYWVNTANIDATDPQSIADGLAHLMAQSVEGLVVIAPQVRVVRALAAQRLDIPYVTLQSTDVDPDHTLSVDQIAGARLATKHLISLGHRHIYHIAGPQDWIEAEARMRGFLEEMGVNDMPVTPPILGDWSANFGYYVGRELLGVRDFTAIFAANDQMALGFIHAIRDEGLDVPRDISIVGFDDIPEAAHFWPPLTTVRQDFAELGRRAVDLLLGSGADPAAPGAATTITPELVVRASTGRAQPL
jgi:DNA-binding LacI/PurR family transcriptional regulator